MKLVFSSRTGRLLSLLALGALALPPCTSAAELSATGSAPSFDGKVIFPDAILEQYDECFGTGVASQQFPDFSDSVLQAADDFSITEVYRLSRVLAVGEFGNPAAADPDAIVVEVYAADGPAGLPGTLLCSETHPLSSNPPLNPPIFDLGLDQSCLLIGGTYWMSVLLVMPFGGGAPGQWFWGTNATGFGEPFAFRDPDQLIGSPCVEWGSGPTTCEIDTTFPNLCLGIDAFCESCDHDEGGDPPVPAVGAGGAIAALALVMAASFFYLRRRRTA